ncbi:PAS domain-containing protein [Sphingobacterium faecium]|uniref:sensor histidine kinase n=1 Tax=Sphingobacterium faecium TaxID=34087 RepID=UPI0012918EB8|nr:PAS domain-containing sensor histidine kinase [Sphingobacterium faecium]MQP26848.1 PAS domain-containing protein [Sphingobacterium faecium]
MMLNDSKILSLLKQSPLATAIYDSNDLNIAYANQAMLDMWRADESILGKTLCVCFPNFVKEGFSSILKNVWKTGITYRATETPAHIIDGDSKVKRYFDFEYRAMVDEKGQCYAILHTASDATDRKLAHHRMEKQGEQISLRNKLDVLANTLAHDLKNPLSVLKLGNDFLSKNENIPEKVSQRWYTNFSDSIQNIESIINQTLQINTVRGTVNKLEEIVMDQKIEEWIKEVKINFPDQQIEFRLGNLYALYADHVAVYQVFTNLIGNAVKYAGKTEQAYLSIYSEIIGHGIVYVLEDNGIGIPEAELNKMFQMQVRGSNVSLRKGTGIGLSLVKDLIEFMGGNINLSSELGKGTIVRLFFPHPITE